MSARVGHALASKIYSQERVGHVLAHGGRTEKRLMAERSEGSPDYSGVTRVAVRLHEMDISYFEKIKSKNFKKGADPRLRTAFEG